jgi:signal transduction histidine kinase
MEPAVLWQSTLLAATLFASTALAAWAAVAARGHRSAPGGAAFGWMMLAVALWSLASAMHTLVADTDTRIVISQIQYLGIAPIGVLWLLFTSGYARARWPADRVLGVVVWIEPALTLALVATNQVHHLHWASVTPINTSWGPRLEYTGGPWYWVHVAYTYALMALGTLMLVRGLRRFPPPYRRQTAAMIAGALIPWIGNVLYLTRALPAALDLTPVAFTLSGACVAWGLYRFRLFGLVPVAHDMVVDSMDDGVLVLDAERRIVDMNAAAERFTGCTAASVGLPIDHVVSWWTAAAAEAGSGDHPAVVRTDPGPRYFEVRVSPVRDRQRRFTGWLVLVRDITARRRSDAERYALERRVQEQQKSESLMLLAGGVAHDFNNLLTGILGNADLIAMHAPPGSAERRASEAIVIGAQRAADLVAKMLAYSGGGRVVAELVDLDSLVRDMVELIEASVTHHCTLTYRSPGRLAPVEADPTQIRQVVLNLIMNAIEAVGEDGIVAVETGEETLDTAALRQMTFGADIAPGRFVFIDVTDNGHGMADDTLARLFDPFFSTKETGRGLGMAAVRGIVRSHNAALRVTSAPGQGTRFRVWFPLVTPVKRVEARREVASARAPARSGP